MKKKYVSILLSMLALFSLVGCNNAIKNNEVNGNKNIDSNYELPHADSKMETITDEKQTNGAQLSDYTEEGMRLFEANFKTKSELSLALKNIGNDMSDYSLITQKGENIDFGALKGKNVIIDVINAHCPDCLDTTVIIDDVLKNTDKDVTFIPVFIKSTEEDVDNFYTSLSIEKPKNVVMDEKKETKTKFSLTKTPSLIFIDKNGKISFVIEEKLDKQSFTDSLGYAFGDTVKKLYEYKNNN